MPDTSILLIACVVFLLAGFIKGFVGFGLPLVAIGLMTTIVGLPTAIALFLVPAFGTNLWQGFAGANTAALFKRYWTFFIPTMFFTWPGTLALSRVNTNYLTALLGMLLCTYVVLSLTRSQFVVPRRLEKPLNPVMGVISGILAGLTGAFTMPGVVYLQSTLLPRDQLVQALGMLFTLSTIGLSISMGTQNLLSAELGLVSVAALLPTFAGMMLGTRIRRRTSEERFRVYFLLALGVLGFYIVARSVTALINQPGL
ncbi:sulfite exporter TauE/SafE family protein [Hoeflea sp. TYP-13]|uniref:sulfite exporter TauE/SafE family protein n=1 Tax=Hoeflea sp. TYP-13 TaxID=3230023 RepID=UPI0034C671DA